MSFQFTAIAKVNGATQTKGETTNLAWLLSRLNVAQWRSLMFIDANKHIGLNYRNI
jgi:hypothetical protein